MGETHHTLLRHPQAIATMSPGDAAIIFTPDDTHHFLAEACIKVCTQSL